jgi:hypothetical protein
MVKLFIFRRILYEYEATYDIKLSMGMIRFDSEPPLRFQPHSSLIKNFALYSWKRNLVRKQAEENMELEAKNTKFDYFCFKLAKHYRKKNIVERGAVVLNTTQQNTALFDKEIKPNRE